MLVLITRLKAAWAVLVGRERILVRATEGDAEAVLRRLHDRLTFATRFMEKELYMALIDDINALNPTFSKALAAKDAAAADTAQQLVTANATIAERDKQIADADAAVQALLAKYAPPTVAPAAINPATGLPA